MYDESLINVPSEQLDPQQLKEKRKQVLMRNSREARERIRREKEEAKAKKLKEEAALEEWRQAHPREYGMCCARGMCSQRKCSCLQVRA